MKKQEFLEQLESIVSRANNEKDYIGYCMIEDTEALLDNCNFDLEESK